MSESEKSNTLSEIASCVAFSAFVGTISLFFTGLLIAQLNTYSQSIRVPILYLIIATFSFLFSGILYTNATGEINRGSASKGLKSVDAANVISEYLGVYLFIISIPLVINSITNDGFLRGATAAVALLSLAIYSQSTYSLFARYFSASMRVVFASLTVLLGIVLFLSQLNVIGFYEPIAVLFLLLTLITTYRGYKSPAI